MDIELVGSHIVDVAVKLHMELGPGLREPVYVKLMAAALTERGLHVAQEVVVPLEFRGQRFERALRVDLLVDNQVIVEVKSTEKVLAVQHRQVLTYLRAMDLRLGFLINFGCATLKEGLRRVVNNYKPTIASPLGINRDQT